MATVPKSLRGGLAAALTLLAGCALLFPPRYEYSSLLVPTPGSGGGYAAGDDGVLAHEAEGLRVEVKPMTDEELNRLFPLESGQGRYSSNPYTYGDYVDPAVGYVRNRFTVFRVTVRNRNHAKVELPPLRALLTTDREGEVLEPYGIRAGSARLNFESYYRTLRGPSGNEYYRFNMRMGIVRTNNYLRGEKIFKGEEYGGFIVFEPLDDEVERATLHIRDLVLRFNAFDNPLKTVDLAFEFDRRRTVEVWEHREWREAAEEATRARLASPSEVSGAVTGDITRDVTAIDAFAKSRLAEVNRCFETEFLAGRASEGEAAVRLTILPSGLVEDVRVLSSSVVSTGVEECLQGVLRQWRFRVSTGAAPAGADSLAAPRTASSARVTATCIFEFIDMRPR